MNKKKIISSNALSYFKVHKKQIKIILLIAICSVMIIRGIMLQPEIIKNKAEISKLNDELKYEENRQEEIENMKESVGTEEYIEKIARDKLGMIKQNEQIYIDVSKSENK